MFVTSLKKIIESEGTLIPIEFNSLPFNPKRIFVVDNVPRGEERGKHAHYETQQVLICLRGKLLVKLYDGILNPKEYLLGEGESIFVDKLIWDSQIYLTGNDIMLSICSTEYNPKDYISNLNEFRKIKEDMFCNP